MPKQIKPLAKILAQLAEAPSPDIQNKLKLFQTAQGPLGVLAACRQFGKAPRYYYYWWNRYRDSGFRVQALEKQSRRPKRSPRQTSPQLLNLIRHYAGMSEAHPEAIRRRLEQGHQVRLSRSTIYRILKSQPKTAAAPKLKPPLRSKVPAVESIGVKLGPYLLEKELGRGAAGVVYLGRDLRNQDQVAIKTLRHSEAIGSELLASLRDEFRALSELQHPHLARVLDFGATEREIYFSSEYISGGDFLLVARDAHLNTVFRLLTQVLGALDYIHGLGILHLDLKPSNILVSGSESDQGLRAHLIDFGGAQWNRKGLGFGREFGGTPPYTAPELLLGQNPTPASDLYALGMLAHQIFTGTFPFATQDPVALMKEQVYAEPSRSPSLHPALPETFGDFLLRWVARRPEDRFSTAREVLEELNRCLGENFSWRESLEGAPILPAIDCDFHPETLHLLVEACTTKSPQVVFLSGPPASGKSRLISRCKRSLQLQGKHPESIFDRESLAALWENPAASREPLLLDRIDFSEDELAEVLDRLENLRRPVLLATHLPPSPNCNPHQWFSLPALEIKTLETFFAESFVNFPSHRGAELIAQCGSSLKGLEDFLQVLAEEGLLQFSEGSWRWEPELDQPLAQLQQRNCSRWEERRRETQEWLKFAPSGLTLDTLAGILGVAPERLEPRLQAWGKQSQLRVQSMRGIRRYLARQSRTSDRLGPETSDWNHALRALETAYQSGRYTEGSELLRMLRSQSEEALPESLAVIGARHLVAAGWAQEALASLPKHLAATSTLRGLSLEIQARAYFQLGSSVECRDRLTAAEKVYRRGQDRLGLSRMANLRGSLDKREGDNFSAEQAFLQAIAEAQAGKDDYHRAIAAMNLAILKQDLGDWDQAQKIYLELFPLEAKLDQPLLSCKLRNNWINLLLLLGRSQEAESACYEFLKLALRSRYPDQQASALAYLAILAAQKNDREGRLSYLQQALAALEADRHPQLYFQCLLDRSQAYWEMERYTAAQLDAESAELTAQRSHHPTWIAMSQILLGKILRDRPKADLAAASQAFNEAHLVAWKQKNLSLLWEIDFERGRLAARRGEIERARRYFQEAQRTLKEILDSLSDSARAGFLRDRKWEHLEEALRQLPASGSR